jgi:acyl-CoA synthetase (NDP forming)
MPSSPLHAIMNPSSIAFVGASNNFTNMGSIQCLNLMYSGFPGEVLPVHPKEKTVLGKKAYALINDLPYAPDLAVLVVPTGLVPDMLEDFGKLGTKYAVIISGGFRETGEGGQYLESRISDIAQRYGMRFIGPNCVGLVNTLLPMNITVATVQDNNGKLGIASQSGTYVTQTLPYLHKHGITISKAISVGNGTNIDIVECLKYLGDDEQTTAIALYIEGISRAGDFLKVAREISARKPIVAQYVGGTEAGARAGLSHTGAMAGPDYVYDGLFEQAGIIRVDTIEDVYKIGWTLASQPPLEGSHIGILTNSGGPSTAIATTCNRYGLEVPKLSDEVQKKVRQFIPDHASALNPIDLTYLLDMSVMTDKIPQFLFETEEIHGVAIHGIMDTGWMDMLFPIMSPMLGMSKEDFLEMRKADLDNLINMPRTYNKPLLISSFFGDEDHAVRVFNENGIPTFDSPEKVGRAMAALYEHFLIRNRPHDEPKGVTMPEHVQSIVDSVVTEAFDEYTAKRILRGYGIPTTDEALANTLDDALNCANSIGYPVVLKVCSPHIMHKTERGMVRIGIQDDDSLEEAFRSIRNSDGNSPILVSEMLAGDREFMAGMSYAPGFPPCIMFGLGGVFAEALKDRAIRLAPLSHSDAISMMEKLSSRALFGPYRGMKPVDMDAVASMLEALGRLALDFPQIRGIDLNPIIITDGMPKVADALFIK